MSNARLHKFFPKKTSEIMFDVDNSHANMIWEVFWEKIWEA